MKNLSFIVFAVFLASCSKVDKFEARTDSMEKTTKNMSSTTGDMKKVTSIMYEQFRSKESQETRQRNLKGMREAKGMGEKLTAAAVYFKSFEFQLWTNLSAIEDEEERDLMFLDAANEITRVLCDLHSEINLKKMSPTKEGKSNNDEMDFYALAATMHMNHTFQDLLVEKQKTEEVSMYDLVKSALIKRHNRDQLTKYEKPFVNGPNKQVMMDLLKARIDIIAALALRNLTDKSKMGLLEKLKGGLFKISGGFFGAIDVPEVYDPADYVTNEFTISYLDAAVKTRQLLQELNDGQEVTLEKTVKSAYEHISLQTKDDKNDTGITVLDDTKEEIKSLINHLL